MFLVFQIDRGNFGMIRNLMWWKTLILFLQMSTSSAKKLYCLCLRTMKQWSRWSFKGRSPTMRHVSRTHRVALDWLFDGINLDPKIQIKYIDTDNKFADVLTRRNFTRDEWIICCVCLTLVISVPRFVLKWCRKERKKFREEALRKLKSMEISCWRR